MRAIWNATEDGGRNKDRKGRIGRWKTKMMITMRRKKKDKGRRAIRRWMMGRKRA